MQNFLTELKAIGDMIIPKGMTEEQVAIYTRSFRGYVDGDLVNALRVAIRNTKGVPKPGHIQDALHALGVPAPERPMGAGLECWPEITDHLRNGEAAAIQYLMAGLPESIWKRAYVKLCMELDGYMESLGSDMSALAWKIYREIPQRDLKICDLPDYLMALPAGGVWPSGGWRENR